jgi:enoyl-CoA hydratase
VGLGRATELMLTGRFVDAEEALAIGLVTHVAQEGKLIDDAYDLAAQIAANSPLGIRLTKRVLQSNMEQSSLLAALELENRGQVLATRSPDMAEALEAFREKRPARFGGG